MSEPANYSEFLAAAMEFLRANEGTVLIISDGPKGFQTYRFNATVTWMSGLPIVLQELLIHLKAEFSSGELARQRGMEETERIDQAIKQVRRPPQ